MKQFFKVFFASMLGFIVGSFILGFLLIVIIATALVSGNTDEEAGLKAHSILEVRLTSMIPERSSRNPLEGFDFSTFETHKATGLNDIITGIQFAAKDPKIDAIYLQVGLSPNSYATLEEIRSALSAFKQSGKPIIAYGEVCDEHSYYVASVANSIYLNPSGVIEMNGFSQQVMYLKSMFDKAGIHPELIRHGKFKAAGEPFIADAMSEANREQIQSYVGSLYQTFIQRIAQSRHIDEAKLHGIVQDLLVQNPADAVTYGLVDSTLYQDAVEARLRKICSIDEKSELNKVSVMQYKNTATDQISISDDKIAVLYCTGEINMGRSTDDAMGSESICESLRKIRKGDYKACVLRINSPGGSALASDIIWREVCLTKQKMPVYVSMGDVAASGGYYIAAPATKIIAQPNTITGSIGVFGILFNAEELLHSTLGIHIETVNFGKYADIGKLDRPMNDAERLVIQRGVDHIYSDFILRVSEGRHKSSAFIDSIAQGRVWSGKDALSIGLVDALGGLDATLHIAANDLKLNDYRVVAFPEQKDAFREFLMNMSDNMQTEFRKSVLGSSYPYHQQIEKMQRLQGFQARMDFDPMIH